MMPQSIHRSVAHGLILESIHDASSDPGRVDRTVTFVDERIGGANLPLKICVQLVAFVLLLAEAMRTLTLSPLSTIDRARRAVRFWQAIPIPGIADYIRLVRSLVLVAWYGDDK